MFSGCVKSSPSRRKTSFPRKIYDLIAIFLLEVNVLIRLCVLLKSDCICARRAAFQAAATSGSSRNRDPLSSPATSTLLSSGVPGLQAHASTNLKVSLFQILLIKNSRNGTRAMRMTGKAGAPFVNVTMKMTTVTMICTAVYP